MPVSLELKVLEDFLSRTGNEIHHFYLTDKGANFSNFSNTNFAIDAAVFKKDKESSYFAVNPLDYFSVLANLFYNFEKLEKQFPGVNVAYLDIPINLIDPFKFPLNSRYNTLIPYRTREDLYNFIKSKGLKIDKLTLSRSADETFKIRRMGGRQLIVL